MLYVCKVSVGLYSGMGNMDGLCIIGIALGVWNEVWKVSYVGPVLLYPGLALEESSSFSKSQLETDSGLRKGSSTYVIFCPCCTIWVVCLRLRDPALGDGPLLASSLTRFAEGGEGFVAPVDSL